MDGKNATKGKGPGGVEGKGARGERLPYEPPRIVKKRAVSRATLEFSGAGPDSGGVIG
jgi:hypothetical protein